MWVGAASWKSKPRFRLEAAAALIADEPPPRNQVELSALAAVRLGKTVLELTDLTVRIGHRTLLDHVTWQLGPGDRVGPVGANGSGKTTLLNVLAGQALPGQAVLAGQVLRGKTVRLGYLTQQPARVDRQLRSIEAARQVRGIVRIGKRELSASQVLDRLGLRGNRQWTPVADLS